MKLIDNMIVKIVRSSPSKWLMTKVIPYIRFTTYYSHPSNSTHEKWGGLWQKGYKLLQPGDYILTIDDKKLTTGFIQLVSENEEEGAFSPSHAEQCLSKDEEFETAGMTHTNFTRSTFSDVCYESTRIVIMRCDDYDQEYIDMQVIPTCKSFKNKKYDTVFRHGAEDLACSELIYYSDPERRLDVSLEPLIGDVEYISPLGLYKAKNAKVVWDSDLEP